jgi:hypothetical protein
MTESQPGSRCTTAHAGSSAKWILRASQSQCCGNTGGNGLKCWGCELQRTAKEWEQDFKNAISNPARQRNQNQFEHGNVEHHEFEEARMVRDAPRLPAGARLRHNCAKLRGVITRSLRLGVRRCVEHAHPAEVKLTPRYRLKQSPESTV